MLFRSCDVLIKQKGGFLLETAPQLAELLVQLLTVPSAMRAASENSTAALASLRGATARTLENIQTSI